MKNKKSKGFTLIELLVVIAIIGILASVALVAMNVAQMRGRDSKRVADTKQVMNALELYYTDFKSYPSSSLVYSDGGASWSAIIPTTYLGTMPLDPKNSGNSRYFYQSTCSNQGFWYGVVLEKDNPARYQANEDDCAGTNSSTLLNNPVGQFVIAKKSSL